MLDTASLAALLYGVGLLAASADERALRPSLDTLLDTVSDKRWRHGYHRYYERELAPYRDMVGLRLLEIGVDEGYSLRAWLEYFMAPSLVEGIGLWSRNSTKDSRRQRDLAAARACEFRPNLCGIVRVREVDQSNQTSLQRHAVNSRCWNIIIDDGSHVPWHQMLAFMHLFPKLCAGGLYVIEDLEGSYLGNANFYGYKIAGGIGRKSLSNTIESFKDLIDVIMRGRFQHYGFTILGREVDRDIVRLSFGDGMIFVEKRPSGPEWKFGKYPARRNYFPQELFHRSVKRYSSTLRSRYPAHKL